MHPLRTARCQHNLTIEELAKEARVGASTVWRAEHNYPINAESRRRLCSYFRATPQALGLLHHLEQHSSVEQESLEEYPLAEDQPSTQVPGEVFSVHSVVVEGADSPMLFLQQEQLDVESLLTMNKHDTWLDAHWTFHTVFDALSVVLQGIQGLPPHLQQTFVLGMLSKVDILALAGRKQVSAQERQQVTEALSASIKLCWDYFHIASPMQIFIVGRGILYLLEQTRFFIAADDYRSYYAAITNLIGSALYLQGLYDVAQTTHKRAYQAALDCSDVWNQAQSLNWQAITASTSGNYSDALRYIQTALKLVEGKEEEDYRRLRAHLFADCAYNASILGEQTLARKNLDASASFLENLEQNEEFDWTRWHQLTGDCLLLNQQYTPAIYHLEQSLSHLPKKWITRRILTLLPLAKAYAYQQERDMSIEIAEQAVSAISSVASLMLKQRFMEYLHVLVELFPRDKIVRRFVSSLQEQLASSEGEKLR